VYGVGWQLRTMDIRKGGNRFAHYAHIERAAAAIFTQLAEEMRLIHFSLKRETGHSGKRRT
jgi:fido (protein-threonine AMPylation protein)